MKSDSDLKKDVVTRLELEPKIDSAALGVTVKDGVVTLEGNVESEEDRASTERAVRFVKGVKGLVDDELRVESKRLSRPNDGEIQNAVREAIQWLTTVPADRIKVTVRNGWLTLEGEVEAAHQAKCIEEVVGELPGVRGVRNALTLPEKCQAA